MRVRGASWRASLASLGFLAALAAPSDGQELAIGNASVVEGAGGPTTPAVFTVFLSPPSGSTVTVDFATADGTATAPPDYLAESGGLTFSPGQTSQTITVTVVDDPDLEPDETFQVNLSNPVNATIETGLGTGTIVNDDGPSISIDDVTVPEGNAGTTDATFTVTLSQPGALPVTVLYLTADGSATAGSDYTVTFGTLSFAPGETSQPVAVPILGDSLFEPDETFDVVLANPTNATIGDGQGVGTIANDDPVELFIDSVAVTEGAGGPVTLATFRVALTGASPSVVSVDFDTADGTATAPADYLSTSGTLTFAPGQTSRAIDVAVLDDALEELAEDYSVVLSNPVNAVIVSGPGIGTILDDDAHFLSIDSVSVVEGAGGPTTTATFTVTLSPGPATQPVMVDFATADGAATAPADYLQTSGTLTFNPGETSKSIPVTVVDEAVPETLEDYSVNLSNPVNAQILNGQGFGTILNDDGPSLVISDAPPVLEGPSASATFTVVLSAPSAQTVSVSFSTADGTATEFEDYEATGGTLTFAPGQTSGSIVVTVSDDPGMPEPNETFFVNLGGAAYAVIVDGQGLGTIVDDDGGASDLFIDDVSVAEGTSGTVNATFTVVLNPAATTPVSVGFATADGTATAPADYLATSGSLSFAVGETSKTLTVTVEGDALDEPDETFLVDLSNPVGALIGDGQGTGTILDDDLPGLVIGDATVVEGNSGTVAAIFTVTLSATSTPVSVEFATADGTATAPGDYAAAGGTLSFAPGETSKTVAVTVQGDVLLEPDETFFVNLSNASGATVIDGQGLGTIVNDDLGPADSKTDLVHGSRITRRIGTDAAPSSPNYFRIHQAARSSYEVLVDGLTGDLGVPRLARLASDGVTELQDSVGIGAGSSRSLSWENASSSAVEEYLVVESNGCTTSCDPGDTYSLRAYDTTLSIARFNNSASQITVLVVQNTSGRTVSGNAWFWNTSGGLVVSQAFVIPPQGTFTFNTAAAAPGVGGSLTISHDGRHGDLAGKAVAVEPATGFTFDTPLITRPR